MTGETDRPEDDDALAAEYALHLLDAPGRLAFERRMASEPELGARVRAWEERLAGMAHEFPETAPPPRVKAAIDRRLFGVTRSGFSPWRLLAGGLVAAALGVAVLVLVPAPLAPPSLTAEIAAEDQSLVVEAALRGDVLEVTRRAGGPPPGRVLELWLIAGGAPAPVSLGVLPPDDTVRVSLDAETRAALAGGTLAISEEPPGGSPTGVPTGAVLAAGAVTEL